MIGQTVLELPPGPGNARNSEGAFITLRSGRVMLAYSRYGSDGADDGHADLAARFSDDGGRTWSGRDRVILRRGSAVNVMSVSWLRLPDGRLALFNLRKAKAPWARRGQHPWTNITCMPEVSFSDDEASSFSPPAVITTVPGYYVLNNDRVIQLRSGRIIVPLALHRMRGKWKLNGPDDRQAAEFSHSALILFYFSDDGGRTWLESLANFHRCVEGASGLQEPGVVELRRGRLWCFCRSQGGCQWQSFSPDQGMRWAQPQRSRFRSPCSPLSVKRIPATGHLLAVWNDHSGRFRLPKPRPHSWGRTPLVSAISADQGRTWRHHRLIESSPDHGYCYTAIHFIDDAVLLGYLSGGKSTKMALDRLRVRRIRLEELYQG